MNNKLSVSYWVAREKTYSIEVKAWFDTKWNWNIYFNAFDNFPLFDDNDFFMRLDIHGGVTFDKQVISQPIGGCRFEWMKTTKSKTVGCDFCHLYDDYDNHPSPFDYPNGDIPNPFKYEAERTLKYIEEALKQAKGE